MTEGGLITLIRFYREYVSICMTKLVYDDVADSFLWLFKLNKSLYFPDHSEIHQSTNAGVSYECVYYIWR